MRRYSALSTRRDSIYPSRFQRTSGSFSSPNDFDRMTCDEYFQLRIPLLRRAGCLRDPPKAGVIRFRRNEALLEVLYVVQNNGEASEGIRLGHEVRDGYEDYTVRLTRTKCHFGGYRHWFICPNDSCKRRVAVLYGLGSRFICRTCLGLIYECRTFSYGSGLGIALRDYRRLLAVERGVGLSRVRYWRGQPTKRYRKFLKRKAYADRIDAERLERRLATP